MTRPRLPAAATRAVALCATWGSMALLLALGGCGERQGAAGAPAPAPAPPAPTSSLASPPTTAAATPTAAPAPAAAASGPTWTLMVTWMSPQAPPATSQTVFHDAGACDRARVAALAEGARLQTEAQAAFAAAHAKSETSTRRYVGRTLLYGDAEPAVQVPPTVAAFCAAS